MPEKSKSTAVKPDTILNSSTGYVDGGRFVMTCNSGSHLFLMNNKGDTLSKIQGEKQTGFAKLPISTIRQYKDYKWGFIKQYWHRNYKRFL